MRKETYPGITELYNNGIKVKIFPQPRGFTSQNKLIISPQHMNFCLLTFFLSFGWCPSSKFGVFMRIILRIISANNKKSTRLPNYEKIEAVT